MNPPRSILSPQFKYVHSSKQDLAATFRRIKREAEKAKQPEPIVRQIGGRR